MAVVAQDEHVEIARLTLGPFGTNAYMVSCRHTNKSVIVDAPAETSQIIKGVNGRTPEYILITHGHMDHLGALSELHSTLSIPVAVHPFDADSLSVTPEILLRDGDSVSFGKINLAVLHTPGHTPGSVCFWTGTYLLSGDTIFPGGPGKTRSPADLRQIIQSITTKIFVLPDETKIFPGHGESTELRKEKEEFAVFSSRPHDPNLCGDVLWLTS